LNHFCGLKNRVDAVTEEIGVIAKGLGFEDAVSHSQPLIDTDLIELEQQHTYKKEEIVSEAEGYV
jgi:hypothetical protein